MADDAVNPDIAGEAGTRIMRNARCTGSIQQRNFPISA